MPYLLDYRQEQQIYEAQIRSRTAAVGQHVAPHVAYVAALWAVLTRMRKPHAREVPQGAGRAGRAADARSRRRSCTPGRGRPTGFSPEQRAELQSPASSAIARESDAYPNYEGRTGASPREMKLLLMNAAQNPQATRACRRSPCSTRSRSWCATSVYEFLKQEPLPGGYHENRKFIYQVRERLIDRIDDEVRTSMGLVEERRYTSCSSATSPTSRTGSSTRRCATRSPAATRIPTRR